MLRIAAGHGMSIDRTLGLTAADLTAGRLLNPPSNLLLNNPHHPRFPRGTPVHLESQSVLEQQYEQRMAAAAEAEASVEGSKLEGSGRRRRGRDPRNPPNPDMTHLRPDLVGDSSQTIQLRREMVLDAFPGVISTCACRVPSAKLCQ